MFKKFFRGSRFIKKMNTLMNIYSCSQNAGSTYQELLQLEPFIQTEGERSLYELNRACLLYDLKRYKESADIITEMKSLNPEFDAQCGELKTKITDAWQRGNEF